MYRLMYRLTGRATWATSLIAMMAFASSGHAATLSPDTQKTVRAATFEVVMRKQDADPLSYEKPLPLDLIPFAIRSDHYWSIGTAFAVAPDTYVTAAHVLLATVGSQFGTPGLRDSVGHVYPIDRVLKVSVHQDFAVFTLAGAPPAMPLPVSQSHTIDDTVFAVGNAQGEGVVVRDGLLTSETPEEQDGRWKWLRFSAAASPGNSGGPLLDATGHAIGIVLRKSANENLNYALPVSIALDAPQQMSLELRYPARLPYARQSQVLTAKEQFALPKPFAEFSREFLELQRKLTQRDRSEVEAALAAQLFPRGRSGRLLATVYDAPLPTFVQQDSQDIWDDIAAEDQQTQELPGRGLVATGSSLGVQVFRLRRPQQASDGAFYKDPGAFMDLLLKGLRLSRQVGTETIRITSLGHSPQQRAFEDRQGRRWQITQWPLGYIDSYLLCYALPTPEGYVGMAVVAPSAQLPTMDTYFSMLTDAVYVGYSGTLSQWSAFLSRAELRPRSMDKAAVTLGDAEVSLRTPRFTVQVPLDIAGYNAASELTVEMTYILENGKLSWDIGAVYLYKDLDEHTFAGLRRQIKPSDETAHERLETWEQMRTHGGPFNRIAAHSSEYNNYSIHDSVSAPFAGGPGLDPAATVLYDAFYSTTGSSYPQDLEEAERRLIHGTHIIER